MSKCKVNGVVDRVWTKAKQTKFGEKTIHYASVNNQEFSTGFKKVFSQGEFANVVVEHKFGEWQLSEGIVPTNEPDLGSTPPPQKSFGGGGGGGFKPRAASKFPIDKTDGQMAIIRQNSMNRAVEILDSWMTPFVEGQAPLWTPASQEEYIQKLHEVALTVTDFNSGQDIMKLMSQNGLQVVNQ